MTYLIGLGVIVGALLLNYALGFIVVRENEPDRHMMRMELGAFILMVVVVIPLICYLAFVGVGALGEAVLGWWG